MFPPVCVVWAAFPSWCWNSTLKCETEQSRLASLLRSTDRRHYASLYWRIINQLLLEIFFIITYFSPSCKMQINKQIIGRVIIFLFIYSFIFVFQVYCGLPAHWSKHTHVWRLSLFQVRGGFPGYFQWLLCDGCSHRSRHRSHILLWYLF